MYSRFWLCLFFFFNDTATTEIYTLSLHDALPICRECQRGVQAAGRPRMVRVLLESSFAGAFRGAPALWQLQDRETVHALDTLTLAASELRPEQYHVSKALWLLWSGRTDRAPAYADSARNALQRRVA